MSPANATATRRTSLTKAARGTILLIEDYSDTRELLSVLLQRRGYEVIEAEDGLEGLLKAGWIYPDLIIMDLSLPGMDGVEATRRSSSSPSTLPHGRPSVATSSSRWPLCRTTTDT